MMVSKLEDLHAIGLRGIVYIVRGVPGSGKSSLALEITTKDLVFSADKWFSSNDDPEEYRANWAKEKLFTAHNWCKSGVAQAMQKGLSPLVVDNTNIKRRDFLGYVDLAKNYQYAYEIVEPKTPWWLEIRELLKNKDIKQIEKWAKNLAHGFKYQDKVIKNKHGVPEAVILRMLTSFQDYREKSNR